MSNKLEPAKKQTNKRFEIHSKGFLPFNGHLFVTRYRDEGGDDGGDDEGDDGGDDEGDKGDE